MAEPIIYKLESWYKSVRQISPNLRNDLISLKLRIESKKDLNHLESQILRDINKAESALSQIQSGSKYNLSQLDLVKNRLESLNASLRQYRENRRLGPEENRLLDRVKKTIDNALENKIEVEKKSAPEKKDLTPASYNKLEDITRDQILSRQCKVDCFSYERRIPLEEVTGKPTAKSESERVDARPRSENQYPASGLLTSAIDAFITRDLARSLSTAPALTNTVIQDLVAGLNAELIRLLSQTKTEFTCNVTYLDSPKGFRIEMNGKLSEGEIVGSTRKLIEANHEERIPLLTKAAHQLIEKEPGHKAEILRLVAEIVNPNASSLDPADIIRTIVSDAVSNQSDAKIEMAKSMLDKLSPTAIPALLDEHQRAVATNQDATKQLLESLILGLAQKIINQAKESAQINLFGKSKIEKDIPTLVVLANQQRLPENLDLLTARSLLGLVREAQNCVDVVGIKSLARTQKKLEAAEMRRNKVGNRAKANQTSRTAKAEPSLTKIVDARKALQELVRTAETANLSIPKTINYVIGNVYAGLAGITAQPQKRTSLPFEATTNFEETRATSSLKRVLAALEADIAKAVGRDASTAARRLVLAAEILLYGIVMRRVKAEIARFDEIIKAIKRNKKFLKGLLANINEGNDEAVINIVDNLILQADKLSYHKGGYDEADLNQALETIIKLGNEPKEVLHKTPDIYTMAA